MEEQNDNINNTETPVEQNEEIQKEANISEPPLPKKKEKKGKKENLEIKKLQEENAKLKDQVLRVTAEMQNVKRRNSEEMSRLLKYDGENFIKKILPIIDNFERAINMDDSNLEDDVSKFLSGFKMIYGNLVNILDEYEIKEIECLGTEFDPTSMEAVLTDHEEDKNKNVVLDVLQKGYTYKDKIIRPSMVKVND